MNEQKSVTQGAREVIPSEGTLKYYGRAITCIGLPTLLVLLYLLFLAQPSYEAETQFIVERNSDLSAAMIPNVGSSIMGGASTSLQDAYLIGAYFQSVDLIRSLNEEFDLIHHYASPQYDWVRRLSSKANMDELVLFFRKQLRVQVAADSRVITLQLKAFDAAYAQSVLVRMIALGEERLNTMNYRMQQSTTQLTQEALGRAKQALKDIREQLFRFQIDRKVVQPGDEINAQMLNLATVDAKILDAKTQLRTKEQFLQDGAFELKALRQQILGLEAQRREEAQQLFTDDETSMPSSVYEYESIKLESEFALHTFTATLAAHEKAKLEALRQGKFLLSLSAPTLPLEATDPKPLVGAGITLILFGLAYGIGRLIVATILDHTV